jgi:RNA ligase
VPFDGLGATADPLGWPVARRHAFASFSELVEHARGLPKTEEGFVIRFVDGLRLKLKGDEYKRIHALISRCTPLAMWEAMQAGDDMQAIRRDLPEEFWDDFDAITSTVGEAAKWTVEEGSASPQTLSGWRPFSRPDIEPLSQRADYDPQTAALSSTYVSALNDYARQALH